MNTILYDLPPKVRSYCYEDADGYQTIVLNSKLSRESNLKSLKHELSHAGDFGQDQDVDLLESQRHK